MFHYKHRAIGGMAGGVFYVLFFILGCTFNLQAVAAAGSGGSDTLLEKAEHFGRVRVIATLKRPMIQWTMPMSDREYDKLMADTVSTIQRRVIDALKPGMAVGKPRLYSFSAQIALTVTADGLSTLQQDRNVLAVDEDIPEPPHLDQSVPHIFPTHSTSAYSGEGWTIAIIDTGIDKNHGFLDDKVVSEACFSTNDLDTTSSSVCPGGASSSITADSGLPCDSSISGCDHGTHVAGIAAGSGNSFSGVAKDATLIAVQAFSRFTSSAYCGSSAPCALSWRSDQISALNHLYSLRNTFKISAINMSLGGGYYTDFCNSDPRNAIIDLLKSAGIATVISSGNDGYDDGVNAPGCIDSAVTIGATIDTEDIRAGFSNNSLQLDLYAPGVNINSSVPGGAFASWDGTSMATPHVTGAWAVMKQRFPTYTVDQVESIFKATGMTITSNAISRQRIDITKALAPRGLRLHTFDPCRLADSRVAGGKIPAQGTRSFKVWGDDATIQEQGGVGDCGIPSTAKAVVINVTSYEPGGAGHFRVFPYNSPLPNASLSNYTHGLTIANASIIPVCTPLCSYELNVYSSRASHVIIDAMGWME